jgi:hypothetical protein
MLNGFEVSDSVDEQEGRSLGSRRAHCTARGLLSGCPSACVRSTSLHNSDIEADVTLGRRAPSGPRSLTPVVRQTRCNMMVLHKWGEDLRSNRCERHRAFGTSLGRRRPLPSH